MSIITERSKFASKVTTAENFWARVDKSGECWLWIGRSDENGYGRVGYLRQSNVGAHRVAWALTRGTPDLAATMRSMRSEGMTQQSIADLTGISRGHVAKTVGGVLPRHQKGNK